MPKYGNGYTAKECIEATKGSRGFVTTIAERLGCARPYVYDLMKKYVTFRQAIDDEREGNKDFVENKLMGQINEGNVTAIIFYLKTQAKDRGYVEKQQIESLVRDELDRVLDKLESKLPSADYERILSIIAK